MQKILLLLAVSFWVGKNCEAQNLVPNPSFEDTVNCYTALDWTLLGGTPDYYNPCDATGWQGVPINMLGRQNAATGVSYVGLLNGYSPSQSYREIIGCQLITPLIPGNKYFANIKISLADSSDIASDKMGISFSTVAYNSISAPVPISNQAIFYSSSIISDTTNWIIISGEFISDSAYSYLIIGNLFDDTMTSTISGLSNQDFSGMSYYYIDDVCVSPDSLACDLNPEGIYSSPEKNSITIFPNPVSEQLTVISEQLAERIELYDVFGRKIYQSRTHLKSFISAEPRQVINLKSFPSGIYLLKVSVNGNEYVRKVVKE